MAPTKTPRNTYAKLDKLRLLVASAIICYGVNRDRHGTHIWRNADAIELYDQYALKLLLHWLATKYGFPIYTDDIKPSGQAICASGDVSESWQEFKQLYPFYCVFDSDFEQTLSASAFQLMDTWCETDLEIVGILYMRCMSAPLSIDEQLHPHIGTGKGSRSKGEFYTPAEVVRYCFSEVWTESAAVTKQFLLLDPACGTGNFLVGAIDALLDRQVDSSVILGFATNSLHGSDIDARAVSLARICIMLALIKPLQDASNGSRQSFHGRFRSVFNAVCSHLVVSDALVPDDASDDQFDLVISNPPYISFGSRNQTDIKESWSRLVRNLYPSSSEYKIRLHSIFQEIAIKKCKPGGAVVLLLPDAFLAGSFYQKLRRLIIRQMRIVSLTELPESTFHDATAGQWCIAHYEKKKLAVDEENTCHQELVKLTRIGGATIDRAKTRGATSNPPERFHISHADLITPDKCRFQLVFNDHDASLLRRVRQLEPVASKYRGRTGIRARHGQSTIVATECLGEHWRKGITSGSQVTAHKVEWGGDYINTDRSGLYGGGHDHKIMEQPKLLMRQTADRPVAGIDRTGLFHLNNVHSFAPLDGIEDGALEILNALVNSALWLHLYQLKSRERNRALAQIDIEMIESMPLPNEQPTLTKAIIHLASFIPAARSEDKLQLNRALDRLVYDLYEVNCEEVKRSEESLNNANRLIHCALPSGDQAWELVDSCGTAKFIKV